MLDEGSFQQLLAAAYVVQEHNRALRTREVQPGTAPMLSEIAEIQATVRAGAPNLPQVAKLITDRLLNSLGAAGVSISLVSNGYLDCVAESGAPANVPGSSLASHSLVATERLKSGQIFDSTDSQTDIRLDCNMCSRLRVESLVAAPIFRFGEIAGLIEVRWQQANAFREEDLSTIKLMADLMTEMLELQVPANFVGEETTVPQETACAQPIAPTQVETVPIPEAPPIYHDHFRPDSPTEMQEQGSSELTSAAGPISESISSASGLSCRVCGHPFRADEAFCGYCSMPRVAVTPSEGLQSKWASLWFIQKAQSAIGGDGESSPDASFPSERVASLPEHPLTPETKIEGLTPLAAGTSHYEGNFSYFMPATGKYADAAVVDLLDDEPRSAEAWTRIVQSVRNRLRLRDVVLALVAAALTFGVVSAWPSSTGQLTWFQSAMVRLGLAQSPVPSPIYGNPDASVWIDTHSKLYYCDGSDLYGNTSDGHFSTQRKAQLDRFESATGLACQ